MENEQEETGLVRCGSNLPAVQQPAQHSAEPSKLHTLRGKTIRPPRAKNCKRYMKERLAEALPEIADALLDAARQGKLPELKMAVQMSGLDEKQVVPALKRFGGRSFEDILLEDWRKEPGNESAPAIL